ncbi:variola b22r-like protein [Albatrosspox virus]|nr:variola b22r-like protein [Penguinpox virus 2]QRM16089.1 variola b22r-like protein [Albatrosspox virus]
MCNTITTLCILITLVLTTYSEFCKRKYSVYHDTGKKIESKEKTDYTASALYRYLYVADTLQKKEFMDSFNWTNIKSTVKEMFLRKCNYIASNGIYMYNYTVEANITVSADKKSTAKKIIKTLLLCNDTILNSFTNSSGDSLDFDIPKVEHVSYPDNGCNNITVDEIIIKPFNVGKGSKVSKSGFTDVIPITFRGVSTHYPYKDSGSFMSCIMRKISAGSLRGKSRINKVITSNCNECSMDLMVDVTDIPQEFSSFLEKNGATSGELSELFYMCMMTDGKHCIDYVPLTSKLQDNKLQSLSNYIKKRKTRGKRDLSEKTLSTDDIKCMYENYGNDEEDEEDEMYDKCTSENSNKDTAKSRSKRGLSDDENSDEDITDYMKRVLGVKDVIPKGSTHLQVGISSKSKEHVLGDHRVYENIRSRSRDMIRSNLPTINEETTLQLLHENQLPGLSIPNDPKHIVSGRLAAIMEKKYENVRSVLKRKTDSSQERTVQHQLDVTMESSGSLVVRPKQLSVKYYSKKAHNDVELEYTEESTNRLSFLLGEHEKLIKDKIEKYAMKGGKNLAVVTREQPMVSTGLFKVDVSTTLVTPSKSDSKKSSIGDKQEVPQTETKYSSTYRSEHTHRRCKRSSQKAVCSLLGVIAGGNNNNNVVRRRNLPVNMPNPNYEYMDLGAANNFFRARGFRQGRVQYQNHDEYILPAQAEGLFRNRQVNNIYDGIGQQQQVYGHIPTASPPLRPMRSPPPPPFPSPRLIKQGHNSISSSYVSRGHLYPLREQSISSSYVSHGHLYPLREQSISVLPPPFPHLTSGVHIAQRPLPRLPDRSSSSSSASEHIYESIAGLYPSGSEYESHAGSIGSRGSGSIGSRGGGGGGGGGDGDGDSGGGGGGGGRRPSSSSYSMRSSSISDPSPIPGISSRSSSYQRNMRKITSSVDKAMVFSMALQMMSMNSISRQARLERMEKGFKDDTDAVLESISTSLTTIGTSMATAGIIASPHLAFAGMGLSLIAGLIDAGKDIYYFLTGISRPPDPVIQKFNMYRDIVSDTNRMGVRKCLMPGSDITVFLSYRNDTSFMPQNEKLVTYFIDTIDSVLYYLNTSGIIVDFGLTVACPIGYLRSPTLDITAYTKLKFTTEDDIKFYQFTRLGAMLSKFPVVELTCGKDITLTLKPFEVPISDMQLLKMATPGEPNSTKSIPSNVCDLFTMKNFYLLVKGCPYDGSQVAITRTTCSILLRMAIWDDVKNRWVLENPFEQNNRHRQLFTFQKFDFNDTVIKPNSIPGHAKFCANRQIKECYWTDVMVLDDITSCANRVRTLYVELYTFDSNRGFTSFVLTCPSGSTPVAVGNTAGLIELPLADFYTVKLFASTEPKTVGVFCMHNYDRRYKSDIIMVSFVKAKYSNDSVLVDTFEGKNKVFNDLTKNRMPWRSRTCVTWRQGRTCVGYYGKVNVWTPDFLLDIDTGNELLITEKYDPSTIDITNLEKSKLYFPYELNIEFSVGTLGMAYDDPNRFWLDAEKKVRTYSSILLVMIPCTTRANILIYKPDEVITVLGYMQSLTNDYGDGKTYKFTHIEGGECMAELDIKTKLITMKCPMFTIPRNISNYEGLCFVTITSRDHCALQSDDYKLYGYPKDKADRVRYCGGHTLPDETDPGHYCGYISTYSYVPYTHPTYEACRANILVHYRDTWIESDVLEKPPYVFNFKYDKRSNNEYVKKEFSDKLKELYDNHKKLIEYRDGALPTAINRLASSLTTDGRKITDVNVDSNILEIAYEADEEKILELEEQIAKTSKDVLLNTLSDEDLEDILYVENDEKCCVLDIKNNKTEKLYPSENYTCGELDDFIYYDNEKMLLSVNSSFIDYSLANITGIPVLTCFYPTIVPVNTNTINNIESNLILHGMEDAIQDILYEIDTNITLALLSNNITLY